MEENYCKGVEVCIGKEWKKKKEETRKPRKKNIQAVQYVERYKGSKNEWIQNKKEKGKVEA